MGKRICIWGDSITHGHVDDMGGWTDRLKQYFWSKSEFEDNSVYNLGISGDNTEKLLKRFEIECEARNPEVIVFAVGINDSQYVQSKDNPRVSMEDFEKNIEKLTEISRQSTNKIVFIGAIGVDEEKVMPIPWDTVKYYDNENIEKYNNVIKSFCEKEGVLFLDTEGVVGKNDLYDGLHPNSEGHRKMFERVRDFLIQERLIDEIKEG